MLYQTNPKVIECLDGAAEARRMAERATDPDDKLTHLHIEQTWRRLADSYALMERIARFIQSLPGA